MQDFGNCNKRMIYKDKQQGIVVTQKDYSKTILLTPQDFKDTGHLLQVVTIPPHTKQRLHFHKIQTEVYYILEGEAGIICNEKEILAKSGDTFICEPNDRYAIWNQAENKFRLVVYKIDFPSEDDTVWLED